MKNEIKTLQSIPVLLARPFDLRGNKTGFNLIIFHFVINGKLSIIRSDKNVFSFTLSLSHAVFNFAIIGRKRLC